MPPSPSTGDIPAETLFKEFLIVKITLIISTIYLVTEEPLCSEGPPFLALRNIASEN